MIYAWYNERGWHWYILTIMFDLLAWHGWSMGDGVLMYPCGVLAVATGIVGAVRWIRESKKYTGEDLKED